MDIYYTIYQSTNLVNDKIYVGKHITKNLNDRYLGSGKLITAAVVKYGRTNFKKEILFIFDNDEDMELKEAEIVDIEFCNRNDTYNLIPGGRGGSYKQRISARERMMTNNPMKDPKQRENQRKRNLGKKASVATKQKMSDKRRGKKINFSPRGEKNPAALVYEITCPMGIVYIVKGALKLFCKEMGLDLGAMRSLYQHTEKNNYKGWKITKLGTVKEYYSS